MKQNIPVQLNSGVPPINSYSKLLNSFMFHEMEAYSNRFLDLNKDSLSNYRKKWVSDPFHSWSRQWEYPYVYQMICSYLQRASNTSEIKILDAGSGVTFFPYYIDFVFKRVRVDCCDLDGEFGHVFSAINNRLQKSITFHNMDIKHLQSESDLYEIVYCISVLEHADDYEKVLREFHRVLKPEGLLILTFDVSIDGFSDISIDRAKTLIGLIESYFTPLESMSLDALDKLHNSDLFLTTDYIKKFNKHLLPWSCSPSTLSQIIANSFNYSMILKIINRIRHPNPNSSIYCAQYQKII